MAKINSEAPHAGGGLHDWILETTRILCASMEAEEVYQVVLAKCEGKGRPEGILIGEIREAIIGANRVYDANPWMRDRVGRHKQRGWQLAPLEQRIAVMSDGYRRRRGLTPEKEWVNKVDEQLVERALKKKLPRLTPIKIGGKEKENLLCKLYGGLNFNLCISRGSWEYSNTQPINWWLKRDLSKYSHMIATPFRVQGTGGRYRRFEVAGERMWLIIEFDQGSIEEQLRKLFWLDQISPRWALTLAVWSGHRSVHGWFFCYGYREQTVKEFFLTATKIGADGALRRSVQITRLPMGTNLTTGERQEILHLEEREMIANRKIILERRITE
jgi:hypothetical protein